MTIEDWLQIAIADAERRGLPGLKPALEGLMAATKILRASDFIASEKGASTSGGDRSRE
jgi:hypothetical protein